MSGAESESSGATASTSAERIAPASSCHTAQVAKWKLTWCKRIGDPALSFIRDYLPNLAPDFKLMQGHPGTAFRVVFYHSNCEAWLPLETLLTRLSQQMPTTFRNADMKARCHLLRQVV